MNTKNLTAACVIAAMSLGAASASFATGGGETPCERACNSQSKANNGWGNGGDDINAGSDDGGTADTKLPSVER